MVAPMNTRALATGLGLAFSSFLLSGGSALAATRCVGSGPGCHQSLQAALDAAHDGDTIKVAAGTFAGGVTITKSVSVIGAGAGATTIKGGGPVVTVGEPGDPAPPVVKLAGVKITGGRVGDGEFAGAGGGIDVPVGGEAFDSPGATLTVKDSVISGNRAVPTETRLPQSPEEEENWPHCPGGFCAFAGGFGAGIQNLGDLTLIRTTVSDNLAGGPVASDAAGAGIWSSLGTLTIEASALRGNRSSVGDPNGRFAEGGAMLVEDGSGPVVIRDTLIGDNKAELATHMPAFADDGLIDVQAHAAGILIANGIPTTIERSVLAGNDVSARNPVGEPLAFDAALQILDSPLTMRDTLITGNTVTSDTPTTEDVAPAGTAVEMDGGGTLQRVHILGNSVSVKTTDGLASASNGLAVYDDFDVSSPDLATVSDSVIAGNTAVARSASGDAQIVGVGVLNNSLLTLRTTAVTANVGRASGAGGEAQGGGIWNGVLLTGPPVELTLDRSLVTGNALFTSPGIERQGGGVFTTEPIVRNRTLIAGNVPDQCFGCGAAASARAARVARVAAVRADPRGHAPFRPRGSAPRTAAG
jgi:hypothetical protein